MPRHEAGETNLAAVRADERYLAESGWDGPLADMIYHGHNVHFDGGRTRSRRVRAGMAIWRALMAD